MSTLLDQNARPVEQPKNGASNQGKGDVRALPTGTLIYNLIRYTMEDVGIDNAIHQLESVKQQQKMVADPPQLDALRKHHEEVQRVRYVLATELNERFAAIDQARFKDLGIEIVVPGEANVEAGPSKIITDS